IGELSIGVRPRVRARLGAPAREIVRPGMVEAIVPQELFDAAQQRLAGNREAAKGRPRTGNQSIFSGITFCARCGHPMHRKTRPADPRAATSKPEQYFVCSSPAHRPGNGCKQFKCREGMLFRILDQLAPLISEQILRVEKPDHAVAKEAERLRAHADDLARRIAKGEERLLELDAAHLAGAQRALSGLKDEADRTAKAIADAEGNAAAGNAREQAAAWWRKECKHLVRLRSLESEDGPPVHVAPDVAREMLKRLGVRIEIAFDYQDARKRRHRRLGKAKLAASFTIPSGNPRPFKAYLKTPTEYAKDNRIASPTNASRVLSASART
ncbi:MAG: serine recombinase, partial [Phycisphaerales bacterium]|nr:serine recombinase [Phycisphaerales bacterium]